MSLNSCFTFNSGLPVGVKYFTRLFTDRVSRAWELLWSASDLALVKEKLDHSLSFLDTLTKSTQA